METVLRGIMNQHFAEGIISGLATVIFCFLTCVAIAAVFEAKKRGERRTVIAGIVFTAILIAITVVAFAATASMLRNL